MNKTDVELWQEIINGDSKAWAQLVKRYQQLVYAVSTRAGLSMSDAADCFQQTWVALYQNRKKLKDPSRLSAWLVTTAKRESMRLRRQAGTDVGDEMAVDQPDTNPLPDEDLQQVERQAELERALRELDSRCQKLVDAFFFAPEERSYDEIANTLGIAPNSLGPIRRRCLEKLKQILIQNGASYVRKSDFEAL